MSEEAKKSMDVMSPLSTNLMIEITEGECLREEFKRKKFMNRYDLLGTAKEEFEIRLTLKDDNGVSILKESIDTYFPLNFYDNETGAIQYKNIADELSYGDKLKHVEGVFNLMKVKKKNGVHVNLSMEIFDKDTKISLYSDDVDKAEFMKTILSAEQKSNFKDSLGSVLKSMGTLSAMYVLFNYNMVDQGSLDNLKTAWDSTVGVGGFYILDGIKEFVGLHTSGENTAMISSALSAVTDIFKTVAENGPVAMIGLMLGIPTFDSLKEMYKSYGERDDKQGKVDSLYNIKSEGEDENNQQEDCKPSFII